MRHFDKNKNIKDTKNGTTKPYKNNPSYGLVGCGTRITNLKTLNKVSLINL